MTIRKPTERLQTNSLWSLALRGFGLGVTRSCSAGNCASLPAAPSRSYLRQRTFGLFSAASITASEGTRQVRISPCELTPVSWLPSALKDT